MIQFSQSKLAVWQTCERKFQLRYVEKNEWPIEPFAEGATQAMEMGEVFHMLVAQKLLLRSQFVAPDHLLNPPLADWWGNFLAVPLVSTITTAADRYRVETSLAAYVNQDVKLFGRIDLLLANDQSLAIFDWKTGRPRSKVDLEHDWQTKIYMALLYQSRDMLCGAETPADQLSMTYWYARDPDQSVKIGFDEAWHVQNWAELVKVANKISARAKSSQTIWPLTDDLATCGRCPFNALCGREPILNPQSSESINEVDEHDQLELEAQADIGLAEIDVHPDI